ncbi:MAG: alpha/beta hydrolase family protein [Syntrophales bacterium]
MKNRVFRSIVFLLIGLPLLSPIVAEAKQEIITVTSRYDNAEGGQNITLPCLLDTPAGREVTAMLLVIPGGNGRINLRTKDGRILHDVNTNPFVRNTALFHESALGLAILDVPSDRAKGFGIAYRKTREHAADIAAVLKELRDRFPKAKVYLAVSGSGGVSALFAAGTVGRDLNGMVLAGIDSSQVHAYDHSGVKMPVLMLHHRADSCDGSPFIEAKEIADRYAFAFVPFSDGPPDRESNPCFSRTKHGFFGLDREMVAAIAGWAAGQPPASPGPGNEALYLNERIVWVPLDVMGGEVRLQTTVYKPDGPGPFPLAVISHGVPFEKSLEAEIRFRSRFCLQSEVFVKRGFAVAVPMRRGYGRSTGLKNETIVNIADFGLRDARDIQATIDYLSREPFIDGKRIVLVGQSGGGLASLAAGSLGNPNVKGIINFAGGLRRMNVAMWEQDMAQAFGMYAKTTQAPSLWFYTANDSFFSPSTAREAYEAYRQNGGQARLVALPAFKRDGHGLFADFEGRAIWVKEVEQFLAQIGFAAAAGSAGGASQP